MQGAYTFSKKMEAISYFNAGDVVYNSVDMSLLKNFVVHERHRFQFRAEFFNALNHPAGFDPPNSNR